MAILDSSLDVVDTIRPRVQGKFIFLGDEKLYIRGVSYGGFRPDEDGYEFPNQGVIERDFSLMADNSINAVRVYTTPPRTLLDIAQRHNLHVMVGLTGEQFVGKLLDQNDTQEVEEQIRTRVRSCVGHPAVLCYVLGNEIPASIVRWLGPNRIEDYLEWLYQIVKDEDPGGIISYVNYPTTEYLDLPFLDLLCFNVYLETEEQLKAYLPRLHNIAGERPLIMSEIGLDSIRNGEQKQASVLDWQIRTSFAAGCAGTFVFGWTDDWHRGGEDVRDWAFGLTDRERYPKPSLESVRNAYLNVPFPSDISWPFISVIVCTYNGAKNIRDCCEGISKLDYPNFEVIIVNDGSTDETTEILNEYAYRVISTENKGLSNARNIGMEAARGEIVAYIDDDAYPDENWLNYLAGSFISTDYSGIGGPNIAPPGDNGISECVSNAPGNPVYVLISDREAEHIPGCNMAFRKADLQSIGGFDPQFHAAGDDVDICWRIQQQGWTIGLNPSATVWHHRRNSLRTYWKQQVGYGKAEAQLRQKWPHKHNSLGHWLWKGQIYGPGLTQALPLRRSKIFHGTWGSAPFQSLYNPVPGTFLSLSLMPEWYILVLFLLGLTALGALWNPLLLALPLLLLAIILPISQAILSGQRAKFQNEPTSRFERLKMRGLTTFLHLFQPIARLWGRTRNTFTSQKPKGEIRFAMPRIYTSNLWSEIWIAPEKRLETVEEALLADNKTVTRGGDYDRWDLELRNGMASSIRTCMAVEDHASGTQLIRFRSWPRINPLSLVLISLFAILGILAAYDQAWFVAFILGFISLTLLLRLLWSCSVAMAKLLRAIERGIVGVTIERGVVGETVKTQ